MTAQVYLVHVLGDDGHGEFWWAAEGGPEGSSSGTGSCSTTDVEDLVSPITGDLLRWRKRLPWSGVPWHDSDGVALQEPTPAAEPRGSTLAGW
ncbi:hypothetical protein [Auraticoccus monumenti]|uniref:Uncharacterized protein n=1 Tax=Auraticoccus monumenti TaxID=675864 RepID=A0A1G7ADX3_9ACTN|nr:hypothetical protein [Auraticoccus monumenti]SDE12999.1 hypothetical protein SAMN04489747_2585 [Auraticoccus monumenti]